MHKRLLLVLAVLITPIFLLSCQGHELASTVDQEAMEKIVGQASDMADSLDNMGMKAYQLGQVGASMAKVDPVGASAMLDEAYGIARQAHSMTYKSGLKKLTEATAVWSAKDQEQVAGALARIQTATTRVWIMRSIAEGIAQLDPGRAKLALADAASEAMQIPDAKYRDLDLRGVAAAMAAVDVESAYKVASQINDPRVKAYALIAVGSVAAGKDHDTAARILATAAEVSLAIQRMEPKSDLLTDETRPEARRDVLEFEKTKLVAASARSLGSVGIAMGKVDRFLAGRIFEKAVEVASGINTPYTKTYTLSKLVMDLAEFDPDAALSVATRIDISRSDARFAALLKAAQEKAKTSGSASLDIYAKAETTAMTIEDGYDRAKALASVAMGVLPYNKEKAASIAGEIEYENIKDDVLGEVAVALAMDNIEVAKEALDKIEEPRFANRYSKYVKAKALAGMARIEVRRDAGSAAKLYSKAVSDATEAHSTRLLWAIAADICKLDHGKLFDMAAKIEEGDYENQAMALSEIAADWSTVSDANAGMVWDMASKAAASIADDAESSSVLVKVASRCAGYDAGRAAAIYAAAAKKANHIGVVEG